MGKRLIDVVLGTVLAVFALPVILLMALGSAIALRSWPFFLHERVGYRGRRFKVPKLRTLPRTTPPNADKYQVRRMEIPAFSRMLRTAHLDELPQLFVVPFGRMSLVGPRPEMPRLHLNGDAAFADARVTQRPGCTGLWQISADAHRLIWEAPEYDLFYVDHCSFRLDMWILWRTALLLSGISGPVTLDRVPNWVAPTPGLAGERALDAAAAAASSGESRVAATLN